MAKCEFLDDSTQFISFLWEINEYFSDDIPLSEEDIPGSKLPEDELEECNKKANFKDNFCVEERRLLEGGESWYKGQ